MSWTLEEIAREWLGGSRIAVAPEVVVEAFARVERVMGRDWIEAVRMLPGGRQVQGSMPTLRVVTLGQELAVVEGLTGADRLVEGLKRADSAAYAELEAIHLLRSRRDFELELYPRVIVGETEREPDFRIRYRDALWTYVEVARPDMSEEMEHATHILQRLANLAQGIRRTFALEVFLRRFPTDDEVQMIAQRMSQLCLLDGARREDLGDLGMLLLNQTPPGQIVLHSHPGEDIRPRLGRATSIGGTEEPLRHIAVSMSFSDERAEQFLTTEARQLPTNSPGLIMFQALGAPSALTSWEPLIRRRFQPTIHTRVSAVCLFMPAVLSTPDGEADFDDTRLIPNPHSKLALPVAVVDAIRESGEDFRRFSGPSP